jgi:CcmD family protein
MQASNWSFVTAAYVITWAVIIGYLVYTHQALRRSRAEYERVAGHRPGEGDAV